MRYKSPDELFTDYFNPTEEELKAWMEDPNSYEPTQDWDLCVGSFRNLEALVRLAHGKGPQREYIVQFLHVATANAFDHDRDMIEKGISLVPHNTNKHLLDWRRKAEYLLVNPRTFNKEYWFNYMYIKK